MTRQERPMPPADLIPMVPETIDYKKFFSKMKRYYEPWSLTPTKWESILRNQHPDFKGNVAAAGMLVKEFTSGMVDATTEWTKHGLFTNRYCPTLVLCPTNKYNLNQTAYTPDFNFVYLTIPYLEWLSSLRMNALTPLYSTRRELIYMGYIPNLIHLNGTEEGDHAGFFNKFPKNITNTSLINNGAVSVAAYDAIDVEFHGLHTQRTVAQKRNFPQMTISILERRISDAKKIRALTPTPNS